MSLSWFIAVCKVGDETRLSHIFLRYSIEVYLPLYRNPLGRLQPLFPSYIFPHQPTPTHELGLTRISYLSTCGQPAQITDIIVDDIHAIETEMRKDPPPTRRVAIGDEVLLTAGFFLGKRGRVVRVARNRSARIMMSNGYELMAKMRDFVVI